MNQLTLIEIEADLEKRERTFREVVLNHNHTVRLKEEELETFFDWWLQICANGKEFLWERERRKKAFTIPLRMKKFRSKSTTSSKFPNYPNVNFMRRLFGQEWVEFKKHLKKHGYIYGHGAGGQFFKKNGKYIWL